MLLNLRRLTNQLTEYWYDELPNKIHGIEFVVATNDILSECSVPSDPYFGVAKYSEYYKLIQAYDAWNITKGSKDVKVAIVDSYFDLTNPEIGERVVSPISIPTGTRDVLPPAKSPTAEDVTSYCHGSHVAGLAIGAQNNKLGCSGIAPKCSWIPVALSDQLTNYNILLGILYGVYQGADVVSFSLGHVYPESYAALPLSVQLRIAMESNKRGEALWNYVAKIANDHNCVLVTSAGNDDLLMGLDPKNRCDAMIKVEAVDNKGQATSFTNFGRVPEADINYSTVSAPGMQLWSASEKRCLPLWKQLGCKVSEKDGFQEMDGTSMSAPIVAGAVALLKSKDKSLTPQQIISILKATARQFDKKNRIGPTIQIKDALQEVGGEALNFDELMKNHELLIGKWKSTHMLFISKDDVKTDDIWTYFTFTSTTSGYVEMHGVNTKRVYKAPLHVEWGTKSIKISQMSQPVTADGRDFVVEDAYVCKPNKDRLLEPS